MVDAVRVVTQKNEIRIIENGKTIKLPAPTTVLRVVDQGPQGIQGTAGGSGDARQAVQAFAAGQVAQATVSGAYDLAIASGINSSSALGLALASASAAAAVSISAGYVTIADWTGATGVAALSPKATYYLSATSAGNLTTVAPSNTGQCVVKIGVAINTQTMLVEIEKPYLIN
jgi:hypothetical protein